MLGDIRGTRKGCLGMVPKLLTDAHRGAQIDGRHRGSIMKSSVQICEVNNLSTGVPVNDGWIHQVLARNKVSFKEASALSRAPNSSSARLPVKNYVLGRVAR